MQADKLELIVNAHWSVFGNIITVTAPGGRKKKTSLDPRSKGRPGNVALARTNRSTFSVDAGLPIEYFTVSPSQVLNFISTSTSSGYVSLTEMS